MPQQRKKQSFLHGALILSAAAILTKIIGALFFKIPLQKINDTAYGYFEAVFNIYIPIYIVSTAGFPIAVSRMVSQSIALGRYRDIRVIRRVANKVFWITGLAGTLLMIIASFFLSAICGFAQRKTDNAGYGTFDIVLLPYDCVSGHIRRLAQYDSHRCVSDCRSCGQACFWD